MSDRCAVTWVPQSVSALLFDLDGTIVDTHELICNSLHKAAREVLGENIQRHRLLSYWGVSLPDIAADLAPESAAQLAESFRRHYSEAEAADVFFQIDKVLRNLAECGYKLALVTTKGRRAAHTHLRDHNLQGLFCAVVTSDDVCRTKPHPEPVLQAVNRLNRDPDQSVMIGDSAADIEAGKAAGVYTAWARWGVPPDLGVCAVEEADCVLRHPGEILRILPRM